MNEPLPAGDDVPRGVLGRLSGIPQRRQRLLAALVVSLSLVGGGALVLIPANAERDARARLVAVERAVDEQAPRTIDLAGASRQLHGWYPQRIDAAALRRRLPIEGLTGVEQVGPAARVTPTALMRGRYRLRLPGDAERMLGVVDELHALARTSPEGLSGAGPRVEVEAASATGGMVTVTVVVESER